MDTLTTAFYTDPEALNPLFPDDRSGKLEQLAVDLINKSAKLSGAMNRTTRKAIAEFLRPVNSYYSNLIEGHDTHPLDIEKALRHDYSENKEKRSLQLEALAHIEVSKEIDADVRNGNIPCSVNYLKELHRRFYTHLPEDFRMVKTISGEMKKVMPGKFRTSEVEVGKHVAPHSTTLPLFMKKFEEKYRPDIPDNNSRIKRIIAIGASHHRLAWIHPFLDGNGRVMRLHSDAQFCYEDLHSEGLWSISRGLARSNREYKERLANADLERQGHYDGRGHLSNKFLVEFCEFFLKTAIDQVDFMYKIMDVDGMLGRIGAFVNLMAAQGKMRKEARFILSDIFLKGALSKSEAMRITNTSDKTLKLITDELIQMGFLDTAKEGKNIVYYVKYPINAYPILFPGVYPKDKEIDIVRENF